MKCCPGDFGVVTIVDSVCKRGHDDFGSGRLEYQRHAVRSACRLNCNRVSIRIPALSPERIS